MLEGMKASPPGHIRESDLNYNVIWIVEIWRQRAWSSDPVHAYTMSW